MHNEFAACCENDNQNLCLPLLPGTHRRLPHLHAPRDDDLGNPVYEALQYASVAMSPEIVLRGRLTGQQDGPHSFCGDYWTATSHSTIQNKPSDVHSKKQMQAKTKLTRKGGERDSRNKIPEVATTYPPVALLTDWQKCLRRFKQSRPRSSTNPRLLTTPTGRQGCFQSD